MKLELINNRSIRPCLTRTPQWPMVTGIQTVLFTSAEINKPLSVSLSSKEPTLKEFILLLALKLLRIMRSKSASIWKKLSLQATLSWRALEKERSTDANAYKRLSSQRDLKTLARAASTTQGLEKSKYQIPSKISKMMPSTTASI